MYEFAPRLAAAATRHLRGLVIVPVLAIMVVLPASAQNSSSSEAQSTGTAILDHHRQIQTKNDGVFGRGAKI